AIGSSMKPRVRGLDELSQEWVFWMFLAGLVFAKFAFLRVPVALASRQVVQPRTRWGTVLAASFMMGLLVLGAGLSVNEVLNGGILDRESALGLQISVELMLISWLGWAIYFNLAFQFSPPEKAMHRLRACLLFGSILELLIALPMHVIVSQRDYIYVGGMTFLGLICGISVLLFAIGPAIYFHCAERWKRSRSEA
ncbi:MAG: hypothetical protein ABMA26_11420, partial [Limisphaerales bacterium]